MTLAVATTLWLSLAKTALLLMGAIIVYLALKGWRRSQNRTMLYLAAGFAIVTVGILTQGILVEILNVDLATADLIATLVAILGFGTILYSLYR